MNFYEISMPLYDSDKISANSEKEVIEKAIETYNSTLVTVGENCLVKLKKDGDSGE